jgi:hypothetical protein
MKRGLFLILVIALSLAPAFASSALAKSSSAENTVFPLEIRNRTSQPVTIALVRTDGPGAYWLPVAPNTDRQFTVQGGTYAHTTYACGTTAAGTLEIAQQLRLIFTPCAGLAPNPGAPTLEKIHLSDSPSGLFWAYHYGLGRLGGSSSAGGVASGGPCDYTATADVTIYTRPSTSSDVFSTQPAGFSIQPTARTSTGWLGFEPGVAQAANIGSFRLRWLPPGSGTKTGGCSSLPIVWAPIAGICYDMPMSDTNVYASADTTSSVLFVLHLGEFAEVLGLTSSSDWAQVDLGPGNTGSHVVGWVEASTLNMNGPCGSLPTVTP